jgi:phospholipid transport system substrate-binding protein
MWRERILGALLALLVVAGAPWAFADNAGSSGTPSSDATLTPSVTVERLHAALIEVMKDAKALGYEGRRQRLDPVIRAAYDLPLMTEIVMGPAWKSLSQNDRSAVVAAFSEWTIANYASRFDGWDGEAFVTGDAADGGRGTIVVHTKLTSQKDEPVALDYRLRKGDDGWRIIDIYADSAISELATRRSEFASVLSQGGLPVLLDRLRQRTQALAQHS